YKFACGKFATNHPIPADQPAIDQFYALYNVNTQALNGILNKAAAGGAGRSPDEQKIGDYYKACMDTDLINEKGLAPAEALRQQYVAHVAKMLELAGSSPEQAAKDAKNIMVFETELGKASMGVVDLREPEKTYHMQPIATFEATIPGVDFAAFQEAIHSPRVNELNNATPEYMPAMMNAVHSTDVDTLKAYMRYEVLTKFAGRLPKKFDA